MTARRKDAMPTTRPRPAKPPTECRCPNLRVEELRRLEDLEAELEQVRRTARRCLDDAARVVDELRAEVMRGWAERDILLASIARQHDRERGHLARIEALEADRGNPTGGAK